MLWIIGRTSGAIIFFVKVGDGDKAITGKGFSVLEVREHWHDLWKGMIGRFLFNKDWVLGADGG